MKALLFTVFGLFSFVGFSNPIILENNFLNNQSDNYISSVYIEDLVSVTCCTKTARAGTPGTSSYIYVIVTRCVGTGTNPALGNAAQSAACLLAQFDADKTIQNMVINMDIPVEGQ
jgi:saccharopine dehydrogenase-like NADP-dependent oxidoreductase